MKKILIIIPTYNPEDCLKSVDVWDKTITSMVNQHYSDCKIDVVIVDNVSGKNSLIKLNQLVHDLGSVHLMTLRYRFTSPCIPMNYGFYRSSKYYDYYIYCASDVICQKTNDLETMINDMPDDCGIMAPTVTSDMIQRCIYDINKSPTEIKLGKAVNGHFFIFTKYFMEMYDYKYPDVFFESGSEEVLPYLCAAIGKKMYLSHKVLLTHIGKNDRKNRPSSNEMVCEYYKRTNFHVLTRLGYEYGFGLRESELDFEVYWNVYHNSNSIKFKLGYLRTMFVKYIKALFGLGIHPYYYLHDDSKFKREQLYTFLKDVFFLKPDELDYRNL